ncbi:MAG: ribonuclease Z [Candidatus Omnitrophica bacterium]|nr:ribonuclease Z [Candidatus Omnitrophota bacterium]
MNKPKIIFLGTSASVPSKIRDNTSLLFVYGKGYFLVDCPGAVVQKLKRVNVDFRKIDKVILTHHHPDHTYGIVSLIHCLLYSNSKITIFSNNHTNDLVRKLVVLFKLNGKNFPQLKYVNVFSKEFFYDVEGIKIKAVRNKHVRESFGVSFNFKDKSVLYSSDTAISKNILENSKDCYCLIHDCTASSVFFNKHPQLYRVHTDSFTLARVFLSTNIKKIIPIHFLESSYREMRTINKELKILGDRVFIPTDFQTTLL